METTVGGELENAFLYVGLDDSNHAGTNTGEIIVASFSFFHEDGIVRKYGSSINR